MRLSHYSVLDRGWAKTGKVLTPQYLREKATHAEQSRVNGKSDAMKDQGGVSQFVNNCRQQRTKQLNHSISIISFSLYMSYHCPIVSFFSQFLLDI